MVCWWRMLFPDVWAANSSEEQHIVYTHKPAPTKISAATLSIYLQDVWYHCKSSGVQHNLWDLLAFCAEMYISLSLSLFYCPFGWFIPVSARHIQHLGRNWSLAISYTSFHGIYYSWSVSVFFPKPTTKKVCIILYWCLFTGPLPSLHFLISTDFKVPINISPTPPLTSRSSFRPLPPPQWQKGLICAYNFVHLYTICFFCSAVFDHGL